LIGDVEFNEVMKFRNLNLIGY